ncbi:NAD(P)-binding domain-containing protein [Ochrobactrum sp. C6C9]|uniref:pyrroline-5-carboxylate reductase n=1 Tax=Ochrobactrum sp. C6C9 TaxID=2736662 RepID=UPI0035303499|nr:NAD(P)-binding domain-containing protein [Ochrobactrum sp. C6C9]
MVLPDKIGFVGTGAITDAIVRGLMIEPAAVPEIVVSPRNAESAGKLAAEFAAVWVAADNQTVVDTCDVVVLAVRPQIAEEVIRSLHFQEGQTVISVIAATGRPALLDWIGADVQLAQAIPLPFVSKRKGTTAIYPPDPVTAAIFNVLGNAVECGTTEEYNLLAAASALMATYFGIMQRTTEWLARKGLPEEKARAYLAPLFAELSQTALAAGVDVPFNKLSREFATKGGLKGSEQEQSEIVR